MSLLRDFPEGVERFCELCGQRSYWNSVVNPINIINGQFWTDNYHTYKKPRTLLEVEFNQLGNGEHWICRHRKKCRQRQWEKIREDEEKVTSENSR